MYKKKKTVQKFYLCVGCSVNVLTIGDVGILEMGTVFAKTNKKMIK